MEGRITTPSGFSTIANHASSSNPIRWLFSVFWGIIMCKVAYDLMGILGPLIFKGFNKLDNAQKLEWKNRGFSTFHALFVVAGSLYFLLVSDLFDEHAHQEWIINRSSASCDTILGMSIGYFLSDLGMIFWTYPTLGGFEFVLHHGLSMFAIGQALLSGQVQFYILIVFITEITTPFVNLRWYLDVAGKKNSTFYLLNGVALFAGWLVARIILFIFFFYHMFTHFYQVKQIYAMGFYSVLTIPSVLAFMNLFWFWKILRGLIKTLSKMNRHSHSS
uniref:TLC domain-containing protein 4-B-like n=1 Tax=Erigeron canadensis TaxID=72917 RepID=UPI001CB8E136|nr:TLC domain-containing protein 4-B-like [Erigeron canadensis]